MARNASLLTLKRFKSTRKATTRNTAVHKLNLIRQNMVVLY